MKKCLFQNYFFFYSRLHSLTRHSRAKIACCVFLAQFPFYFCAHCVLLLPLLLCHPMMDWGRHRHWPPLLHNWRVRIINLKTNKTSLATISHAALLMIDADTKKTKIDCCCCCWTSEWVVAKWITRPFIISFFSCCSVFFSFLFRSFELFVQSNLSRGQFFFFIIH